MLKKIKQSISEFEVNSITSSFDAFFDSSDKEALPQRDFSSCELVKIKSGLKPSVIVINGFLSKDQDAVDDWFALVNELYPNHEVFKVEWAAGSLGDMALDEGLLPNITKKGLAARVIARTNLAGAVASGTALILNQVAGHWKKAFFETLYVGKELSQVIDDNDELRDCILMGHSLGGRVVRHTLNNLKDVKVSKAYILAGAVSSEDSEWADIVKVHRNIKIINCYSDNDYVLKTAYKTSVGFKHDPAGLNKLLPSSQSVLNLDVSVHCSGHTDFKKAELGKFLNLCLFESDNDDLNLSVRK